MEEEVGAEVELHLPCDTLDGVPLDETQDTRNERDRKNKQREKENLSERHGKVWILDRALQFIKKRLKNLWTDQEYSIRHNHEAETEKDRGPIPKDILLETE